MLLEWTIEEREDILNEFIESLLVEIGIKAPPIDAFIVTRYLGITVALDDRQSGRARYVRLQQGRHRTARATILLQPEDRPERHQWALAHEIGEHLAPHLFERWGSIRVIFRLANEKKRPISLQGVYYFRKSGFFLVRKSVDGIYFSLSSYFPLPVTN